MSNNTGIRASNPDGLNKGHGSIFRLGSWVWQTPEEGRRHTGQNIVNMTIKMKTIVQKPWKILYCKLFLLIIIGGCNTDQMNFFSCRNNLTIIDSLVVQGQGGQGEMRFSNRKAGSQAPLPFEMTEKHLKNCDSKYIAFHTFLSNPLLFLKSWYPNA